MLVFICIVLAFIGALIYCITKDTKPELKWCGKWLFGCAVVAGFWYAGTFAGVAAALKGLVN